MTTHRTDAHRTDAHAIHALFDAAARAWARGDAQAYAACFTPDADYVTFVGSHYQGRDAIGMFGREPCRHRAPHAVSRHHRALHPSYVHRGQRRLHVSLKVRGTAAAVPAGTIDRDRLGVEGTSYGGQLSDWLITQTNIFKAAIPTAGISNLISYNYMTYYNQYEEMEFGQFLTQGRLMDEAWERSALKHVANVHTPTMLVHG